MATAAKKTDWANIPDDDEEDEYENEEEEVTEQETHQKEASETITNEEKEEKHQVSGSENKKAEMATFIKNSTHPKVFLNLFNISANITENDIREFYKPLKIDKVLPFANKIMYDLEFSDKEDALKVVEKGVGVIQNESFKLRISNKSLNPKNFNYDKRDKFEKGTDSRRYGHQDRKGGSYYDQKETRTQHGQKRNEGRYNERRNDYGGNRKYQDEPKYVKKEEEGKLPAEWEKVWAEREKNENPVEASDNQGEYDRKPAQNGKYGSDNRSKGNAYHNEDYKEESIVKKGRGQTKYGNEDTLEQDKILQRKDYQDSSNYRGDGKGNYSNRNKGGYNSYENNYSSRDYKEKQGYNKDYKKEEYRGYQGRNNDDKFKSNNPAGQKTTSKEVIYVQKNSKEFPEKSVGDKTAESPKQRKSLNSGTQGTNKTNIFTLLE